MSFLKTLPTSVSAIVALALLAQICHAQNSPQDYVDVHNAARAAVGVGYMEWDDEVAAYAEQYASERKGDCVLQHSQGGPYGENLAWGSGDFLTGTAAVQMWVDEQVYYDYNSNTCADGEQCGHYTQVVWANSVRVGCARVECDNGGGVFIICSYDPPGNYIGQRPF